MCPSVTGNPPPPPPPLPNLALVAKSRARCRVSRHRRRRRPHPHFPSSSHGAILGASGITPFTAGESGIGETERLTQDPAGEWQGWGSNRGHEASEAVTRGSGVMGMSLRGRPAPRGCPGEQQQDTPHLYERG